MPGTSGADQKNFGRRRHFVPPHFQIGSGASGYKFSLKTGMHALNEAELRYLWKLH